MESLVLKTKNRIFAEILEEAELRFLFSCRDSVQP